jgi:hypothetical protein
VVRCSRPLVGFSAGTNEQSPTSHDAPTGHKLLKFFFIFPSTVSTRATAV